MGTTKKSTMFIKKVLYGVLLILVIGTVVYFVLPEESRKNLNKTFGIEEETGIGSSENIEDIIVVRKMTSRKALIGGKWIISGKLFNVSDSTTVNYVKLMFNFSDGVETFEYDYKIQPQNSFGKKFKEKVEGHGDADFEDIDVMEVGTEQDQ